MKYIHFVESFSTGVFSWIQDVASHQVARGNEVTIVHSLREETPSNYRELFPERVKFVHIQMRREISPLHDLKSVIRFIRVLRTIRPDVLHLHSSKAGVLGRVAAMLARTRCSVFYTPHGLAHLRQDVSRFKQKLFRFIEGVTGRMPGQVLACSAGEYESLEYLLPKERLCRLDNAIDCRSLISQLSSSTADKDEVVICTLGGIRYQKAPWMFADIASQIGAELGGVPVKWKWVGDGDTEYVQKLRDAGVEVTGWMSRMDALKTINECDIYLQTSLWEGLSLSVLEAQCLGLPAVISDCIGNREAISVAHTGYVARNIEEFLQALSRLILDEGERQFLSDNARQWVCQRYSLQRLLKELDAVYAGEIVTGEQNRPCLISGSTQPSGFHTHVVKKA